MQTIDGLETRAQGRAAIWTRRSFLVLLLALVVTALTGLLGVRTTTQGTESSGWRVELTHASTARAGLDVPWEATVRHEGGFGREVVLAVTGGYFDIYETQGFTPEPTEATRDADTLYLTFAAPPGDTLVVAYDAYIQPAAQVGDEASLSVVEAGERVATVDFATTLVP